MYRLNCAAQIEPSRATCTGAVGSRCNPEFDSRGLPRLCPSFLASGPCIGCIVAVGVLLPPQQCTTNCLRLAIITLMHVQIYCANYLTLTPTCTLVHTHNFVYTYNSDPTKRSLSQLLNFGTDIINSNNSYFSH